MRTIYLIIPLIIGLLLTSFSSLAEVVIVGHKDLKPLNSVTIKRIYTGRVIEVEGTTVYPVNMTAPNPVRESFLNKYIKQNEDEFQAYWTVRRFIGKGTPPIEISSEKELIHYIQNQKGAIGYLDISSEAVPEGVIVLNE